MGTVVGQEFQGGILSNTVDALAFAYANGRPQTVYVESYVVDHERVCHKDLAEQSKKTSKVHLHNAGSGLLVGPRQVWTAKHIFIPTEPRRTQAICALVYYDLDEEPIVSQRFEFGEQNPDGLAFPNRDLAIITLSVPPPGKRSCIDFKDNYLPGDYVTKNGFILSPTRNAKELGAKVVAIDFGDPDRSESGDRWFHSLVTECSRFRDCTLSGPSPDGNSGGPVWSAKGELIGLIVAEREPEVLGEISITNLEELISFGDYIAAKSCTRSVGRVSYNSAWTSISDPTKVRDGIPVINLEVVNPAWEDLPAQIILEFPNPLRREPAIEIGTDAAAAISFLEAGIVITDDDIRLGRVVFNIDWLRATHRSSSITQEDINISVASFPIYYATPGKLVGVPINVTVLNKKGGVISELGEKLSVPPIIRLRNSGLFKPEEIATTWLSRKPY